MNFENSTVRRRRLLTGAGAWAAGALLPADQAVASLATRRDAGADTLLGGARYKTTPSGPDLFALAKVVPASQRVVLAHCGFFPHGWAVVPHQPGHAVLFEKMGPGAGVFDVQGMAYLGPVAPADGRFFYGHGVFAQGGELLLSTEADAQGNGYMGVRDGKTFRYQGDFPTFGVRPHDCHLTDGGRVLVVTNGGGEAGSGQTPCVAYIDVASRQLLHKHDMPGQAHNTGHLVAVDAATAWVVSAPRLGLDVDHTGAVSVCRATAPLLTLLAAPADLSPGLLGEALSICVVPHKDLVAVTHPTPGWLTFWRLTSPAFVKAVRLPRARGVALTADGAGLWVSHGAGAALSRISLDTLVPDEAPTVAQSMLAGSHLLNTAALA